MEEEAFMSKFDEDITDEEIERVHVPIQENFQEYLVSYIIPEVVAFQIANNYYRGGLGNATFEQHYKSYGDVINGLCPSIDVADEIFKLLKIKYALVITDDNPMKIEKI